MWKVWRWTACVLLCAFCAMLSAAPVPASKPGGARACAALVSQGETLLRAGKMPEAQAAFQKALALEPHNFQANRALAAMLLARNQLAQALPHLRAAHVAQPEDSGTSYNLALTELLTGNAKGARVDAEALRAKADSAEAHSLLGRIDEQEGQFVAAANEFETAAHMDPSEENLYLWGGEMLQHRTFEPAAAIFRDATQRYPQSPRLWVGLGMALYSREMYAESVQALVRAAELDPRDPRCYLFLSKAYLSAPDKAGDALEVFQRYAALEPDNARAQFYNVMALWKARRTEGTAVDFPQIEALLMKVIHLDSKDAEAHLQLGILYNEEHAEAKAVPEFERALQLNPSLAEAHFRLGRYYARTGEKDKAQAELDRFKSLQASHQAQVDKERAEVQQFVVSAGEAPAAAHP